MSVKVIIERQFKEALTPENLRTIEDIRIKATQQEGYVSGETLINSADDREVIIISTWSSLDDWEAWSHNQERAELDSGLAPHLAEPVKITPYLPGADAIREAFEQFVYDSDVTS